MFHLFAVDHLFCLDVVTPQPAVESEKDVHNGSGIFRLDITNTPSQAGFIFEIIQPSGKSGLFIWPSASERKLRRVPCAYEIAYIICCNVFPMGWNILS